MCRNTESNPITGLDRPLGFQEVEAHRISRQSAYEGGKVVSPTHWPRLAPRKYSWYSFLLEAESTARPQCQRKDYVNDTIRNRTRELPVFITVPQPTALPRASRNTESQYESSLQRKPEMILNYCFSFNRLRKSESRINFPERTFLCLST
jgi:hypothetical protein